jgi:LacI family transcriptional regulator
MSRTPADTEKSNRPRVALLIESSRGYGRGLLEGIAHYRRSHGNWSVFFQERRRGDPMPEWLKGWTGQGIIARVEDRRLAQAILKLKIPAIDLRGLLPLKMPLIETDDREAVRLVVEHLLERGFRNFAFCGFKGANYSDKRCAYFVELIEKAGLPYSIYEPKRNLIGPQELGYELHGVAREQDIARWLLTVPSPVAIMACNDVCGQQVLNACRETGRAVPDEAAVIGVDNDELLCELSDPPLSSLNPDTRRIGFMAAELLDGMMRGAKPPPEAIFVPPLGVVTRRSTDVLAMEDREIASALRYIRERVCEGINVADVVAQAAISRSLFERRFLKAVGRTPKAEIIRARIERVKDMLANTDLPPRVIATKTGFSHHEYMFAVFKKMMGQTPRAYRNRSRL